MRLLVRYISRICSVLFNLRSVLFRILWNTSNNTCYIFCSLYNLTFSCYRIRNRTWNIQCKWQHTCWTLSLPTRILLFLFSEIAYPYYYVEFCVNNSWLSAVWCLLAALLQVPLIVLSVLLKHPLDEHRAFECMRYIMFQLCNWMDMLHNRAMPLISKMRLKQDERYSTAETIKKDLI